MSIARKSHQSTTVQDLESLELHQCHKKKLSVDESDNSSICTDHSSATIKRTNFDNERMNEHFDDDTFRRIRTLVKSSSDEDVEGAIQNQEGAPLFSRVLDILDSNTSEEVARRELLRAIVMERFVAILTFLHSKDDSDIRSAIEDDNNGMPLISTMPGVYTSDEAKRSELFRAIAKYFRDLEIDKGLEVEGKKRDIHYFKQRIAELEDTISKRNQRIERLIQQNQELNQIISTQEQQLEGLRNERWEAARASQRIDEDIVEQSSGEGSIRTNEGSEDTENQRSGSGISSLTNNSETN